MFGLFQKKKQPQIAIDIGNRYTKFIQATPKDKSLHIDQFYVETTPSKAFEAGSILNSEAIIQFLTQSATNLDLGNRTHVISCVSGKNLIVKKIEIPNVEPNLIPEHLPFEIEQYIPYDTSEIELDYEILEPFPGQAEGTISVLFVVALKEVVNEYDKLFSNSYLNCDVLDANILALANCFEHTNGKKKKENLILCDIGASYTSLLALHGGQVVFSRGVPVGGNFYNDELQKKLGLDFEEAEDMKKQVGGEETSPEVSTTLQASHAAVCEEIYSNYEFYKNFFPQGSISEILLTGGAVRTEGLVEALNSKFSIPCSILDPFKNVTLAPHLEAEKEKLKPYFPIGLGLSLRSL